MSAVSGGGWTPGPWFAEKPFYSVDSRQRVTPIYARDPDRLDGIWLVAWCHHEAVPAKQRKANARLIAAAPELYEALDGLLAVVNVRIDDPRTAQFDAARAALAKATGEQA